MQHACGLVPCGILLRLIAANSDDIISSLLKIYLFSAEVWTHAM